MALIKHNMETLPDAEFERMIVTMVKQLKDY